MSMAVSRLAEDQFRHAKARNSATKSARLGKPAEIAMQGAALKQPCAADLHEVVMEFAERRWLGHRQRLAFGRGVVAEDHQVADAGGMCWALHLDRMIGHDV